MNTMWLINKACMSDFKRIDSVNRLNKYALSPLEKISLSLHQLKESQSIGNPCSFCSKVLIDNVTVYEDKSYHKECYMDLTEDQKQKWVSLN